MSISYSEKHNRRMAESVLAKIKRVYGLTEDQLGLPDLYRPLAKRNTDAYLQSGMWTTPRDRQIGFSNLDPAAASVLDKAAVTILNNYFDALSLRETIITTPKDQIPEQYQYLYPQQYVRLDMADAYINHVSNESQKILHNAGLNDRSALSLHGNLIKTALMFHRSMGGHVVDYIDPVMQKGEFIPTDERIAQVENHWRGLRDKLVLHHRIHHTPTIPDNYER